MAQTYADLFVDAFSSPLEQAAVDAFACHVRAGALGGRVVDVGCGVGHVAAHLVATGLAVTAVDPSDGMLAQARRAHPELSFTSDDASLRTVDLASAAGVLARFSLIHVPPDRVRAVLSDWASRLRPSSVVLLAGQSTDEPGVAAFDHAVAPAWRWHPDTIADALADAGFTELWRTVSRPAEGFHRFPEFHVCAERRA
ncbi:class I SAM-dependent methyltransferase [Gordonia spumicola]|nr:class I SAM-dependent methyltransferase [Gordonia spumicola]